MDKKHIFALTSRFRPYVSDGTITDQLQSCELPQYLQLIAALQNLCVTRASSGQELVGNTIQGSADPTLGSEVNCTSCQSSFGVDLIASSLSTLQIAMDAEKAVACPIPLSLASHSTHTNCYNTDSSPHSCEEYYESGVFPCIEKVFLSINTANEVENGPDLTFKLPTATSSRKPVPPGALHPAHHQGIQPRETSYYNHWVHDFGSMIFPSRNERDEITQSIANRIPRIRRCNLSIRVRSKLRGNDLAKQMTSLHITPSARTKLIPATASVRYTLRQFLKKDKNRKAYLKISSINSCMSP